MSIISEGIQSAFLGSNLNLWEIHLILQATFTVGIKRTQCVPSVSGTEIRGGKNKQIQVSQKRGHPAKIVYKFLVLKVYKKPSETSGGRKAAGSNPVTPTI